MITSDRITKNASEGISTKETCNFAGEVVSRGVADPVKGITSLRFEKVQTDTAVASTSTASNF